MDFNSKMVCIGRSEIKGHPGDGGLVLGSEVGLGGGTLSSVGGAHGRNTGVGIMSSIT